MCKNEVAGVGERRKTEGETRRQKAGEKEEQRVRSRERRRERGRECERERWRRVRERSFSLAREWGRPFSRVLNIFMMAAGVGGAAWKWEVGGGG